MTSLSIIWNTGSPTLHEVESAFYTAVPVDIKGCDEFWEGHVGCDGPRHAYLVDMQVGVWRDDGTGGEIHTLTHEVTSDSALLPL